MPVISAMPAGQPAVLPQSLGSTFTLGVVMKDTRRMSACSRVMPTTS